jgi:hypothetical protein
VANVLGGNTVLPLLQVEGAIAPPPNRLQGDTVLLGLQSSGEIGPSNGITGDTVLKMLRTTGKLSHVYNRLRGNTRLPMLTAHAGLRIGGNIFLLTGKVRATGGTLLTFIGPPDRSVKWEIVVGGGAIFPHTDYTDPWGRAIALYQAGGFVGPVKVQVLYGS